MKSKGNSGFWSTFWGVTVKARRAFEALAEDESALKKGLLVLFLFFGLLGIFSVIFLDKGYPGTTLFTLPINIEEIYSIPIWFPAVLILLTTLATIGFLTLCVLALGKSTRYTSSLARISFALTIPLIFTILVFFLLVSIALIFDRVSPEHLYNWFRGDGLWFPIVFQVAGIIWMGVLLALATKQITQRSWLLSIVVGIAAVFVYFAPHLFFLDQCVSRTGKPRSISIQYTYPLYPWEKDYHQCLVFKLKSRTGSGDIENNVQETLERIKVLHSLSRGMPTIVYLSGWQEGGFDRQYPDLTKPGRHLIRPGIDSTPLAALKWLIEEAKNYNASVSLHINMQKATADNELYRVYKEEDLLCKGVFGQLLYTSVHSAGFRSNRINTRLEWERGFAQRRIDDLMEMLPELSELGTIHIDNFRPFPSTGHRTSSEAIMPYIKLIMAYFKDNYGVDVTSESTFNRRPNNDNMYGFQPWALSFAGMSEYQMRVPAYMYSGGHKYQDEVFGSSGDFMPLIRESDFDAIKEVLYTRNTVAYYLNRLIRLEYLPETNAAIFSNEVISIEPVERTQLQSGSSTSIIKRGDDLVKNGTDIFVPALWRSEKEIVAYSKEGYTERTWKFPPGWPHISVVDIYEINIDGINLLETGRAIQNNAVTLSLSPNQAVSIVPSGTDVYHNPPIPPSGEVVYLGEDRETRGSWIGRYGAEGHAIVGGNKSLPAYIEVRYVGGEESIWTNSTKYQRALQKVHHPEDRMIAQRSTPIHELIDVTVNNGATQDVALYFIDWDYQHRQMIIDAVCANTNRAIHTVILKDFSEGVYLNYRVKGRIQFRFTILAEDGNTFKGGDVTYSGIFFGRE